ncbi:unnamed protein product [Didymodactylos carnosus]|uniref:Ribosomal protein eL8/eL30/eS12/Gadd45 domain-containing protein n=1 Tax=Didymodactylos carnosus TaxID=1234261 RepID=A0A814A6I3_9BILA|nr:unnamed protein product [Didymodactylos carnosus]CAF3690136.1 unnamed protein product [Didymodactylos carnosus]
MAETVTTSYPTSASPGGVPQDQSYGHQQYTYQAQAHSPGGAGASYGQINGYNQGYQQGVGGDQQQQEVEYTNQNIVNGGGGGQEYSQYGQYATRSGVEGQQYGGYIDGASGSTEQNPGALIQQFGGGGGGGGQLVQGPHGSYKINFDPNPQIIRKHANDAVTYKQEVAVRYLRPPTPPPPGPLIIKEVRNPALPAAPPIVIRQRPPRPATPPPLIIRERPPQPPAQLGPKLITKPVPPPPPPPRRVIIERMPPLPPKPQSIIVERWLPYKQQKRRVIYQKAPPVPPPAPQKNLIIQWEGTQARVVKEFRNLGIIKADPNAYVQQYGSQLRPTQGLPDFVKVLPTPNLGPEYNGLGGPDTINPALLANGGPPNFGGQNGYDVIGGGQGLLASASGVSLSGGAQNGYAVDGAQFAGYGDPRAGVIEGSNIGGFGNVGTSGYSYQQAGYSTGSTQEGQGQQFGVDPQQGGNSYEQTQGYQNVQYQTMPVGGHVLQEAELSIGFLRRKIFDFNRFDKIKMKEKKRTHSENKSDTEAMDTSTNTSILKETDKEENGRSYEDKFQFMNPIANPVASKKIAKKLFKCIKQASKHKNYLRLGLRETQKYIRRGEKGLVVLAGNVTPIDIYSHMPVVCEEANIPYVYVPSKEDLGSAVSANRTACLLLIRTHEDYKDLFDECVEKIKTLS